ncbi:hypothetical protein [Legionella shakespearei]|uniref:Tfp pilus assembly protein PilX n=1 Tax=Legionella shakespearei DSM 23087 TaxID=1122169 RepID=A0A0W0Z8J6_9GAMM|nr:hypothetical protein [Legionella shakespearei]KTD65437.1 hypothetical protein Lsha_0254 [Legionella shakespearei DSM 23087]
MSKHCGGFVFLMTLSIISIITLLLMTSMQQVLLYHKAINRQEKEHQSFYQLEAIALQLARKQDLLLSACVRNKDGPNGVIDALVHNEGCLLTAGQIRYRYYIEDLGAFPCLVSQHGDMKQATHHLRITLLQMAEEAHDPLAVLQIRYLKPEPSAVCPGREHRVAEGISSWRYFPDFLSMKV